MPLFSITIEHDLEFEVFCATCGAGLCNQSDTRYSRGRQMPQVTVEVCSKCVEGAKDELEKKISSLEKKISSLEDEINDLHAQLSESNHECS